MTTRGLNVIKNVPTKLLVLNTHSLTQGLCVYWGPGGQYFYLPASDPTTPLYLSPLPPYLSVFLCLYLSLSLTVSVSLSQFCVSCVLFFTCLLYFSLSICLSLPSGYAPTPP